MSQCEEHALTFKVIGYRIEHGEPEIHSPVTYDGVPCDGLLSPGEPDYLQLVATRRGFIELKAIQLKPEQQAQAQTLKKFCEAIYQKAGEMYDRGYEQRSAEVRDALKGLLGEA